MKKAIVLSLILSILCMSLNISVLASENIIISVDNINSQSGGIVDVPIHISGNTGICGATILVTYDNRLELTNIAQGSSLSTLTMTKPGDMTSNPFVIVWDGQDEDKTKGTIATLVFTTPKEEGIYNISVSYQNGDIVNGKLLSVSLSVKNGSITVKNDDTAPIKPITSTTVKKLTSTYKFNISSEIELNEENVIVATYDENGKLISLNITTFDGDTEGSISIPKNSNIRYAKVFVWTNNLCPLGGAELIDSGF